MKIKYFKKLRHKNYSGIHDLFLVGALEWWIAGITLFFPIINKDEDSELNKIREKANGRLFCFYGIISLQLALVFFLNK